MVQPYFEIGDRIAGQLHVIGRTKVGKGHSDVTPEAAALFGEREGASDALVGLHIVVIESRNHTATCIAHKIPLGICISPLAAGTKHAGILVLRARWPRRESLLRFSVSNRAVSVRDGAP